MKRECPAILILCFLFFGFFASAQITYEREHRIRKVQFPENAVAYIQEKLMDAKHIRYYKEIDSSEVNYKVKFKKERLWYGIEFDKKGLFENIEILIKSIDIPDEAFEKMDSYLKTHFKRYRIRRIHQQYPPMDQSEVETSVKNAFQNLMIPSNNYELIVSGKQEKGTDQYEVLFDADGDFISIRKSLPPNYDHVRY
ncbi:hypothetical protein [Maribacter sp. 2308TA10-17]|uniref:hypothetical protein n=1 Tax=Maribacter sp. 2308TA10-17 TaxID=3386276 RepID=UPI0039BD8022